MIARLPLHIRKILRYIYRCPNIIYISSLISFLDSMLNCESNLHRSFLLICHCFWSVALLLPEFRIARVPSKIRTFQIVAHKLKQLTLFDSWMFAASVNCLLNNVLSRICLLRFFKYNKLKMSKTHFFQMAPRIYYYSFFNKLFNGVGFV
jgi:hypothetical protein